MGLALLLTVPVGLGLAWARPRRPGRSLVEALLLGLALATLVEALQVLTPSRTPQLAEVWRNALGAGLGALALSGRRARSGRP